MFKNCLSCPWGGGWNRVADPVLTLSYPHVNNISTNCLAFGFGGGKGYLFFKGQNYNFHADVKRTHAIDLTEVN